MPDLHPMRATQDSYPSNDPVRPIEPRQGDLVAQHVCSHPWSRIAIVTTQRDYGYSKLQCFDCGAFMMNGGADMRFELK